MFQWEVFIVLPKMFPAPCPLGIWSPFIPVVPTGCCPCPHAGVGEGVGDEPCTVHFVQFGVFLDNFFYSSNLTRQAV